MATMIFVGAETPAMATFVLCAVTPAMVEILFCFVVCSNASKGHNYLFVFAETPSMATFFLSCCCALTPAMPTILI